MDGKLTKIYITKQKIMLQDFPLKGKIDLNIIVLILAMPFFSILQTLENIEIYDFIIDKKIINYINLLLIIIYFISFFILLFYKNGKQIIYSYEKSKNFIGLFSYKDINGENIDLKKYIHDKIIIRASEVNLLKKYIYEMYNGERKTNSICIVGSSGSGKSTIAQLLIKDLENIDVIDCTDRYLDLSNFIRKYFNEDTFTEIGKKIHKSNKKFFFLFDQFERFFLLPKEKQLDFRHKILYNLKQSNVTFLFIIRDDYFSKYIYNINIYNIAINKRINNGLLTYFNLDGNENDKPLIFYCENTDSIAENPTRINKIESENRRADIKDFCLEAFDIDSEKIFESIKDCKLIEQQIFLNILENEKEDLSSFDELLNSFIPQLKKDKILKRYYDQQIYSTGQHWNAIRILYLLSVSRKYNKTFTKENIKQALFITNNHNDQFDICIKKLCNMHLIQETYKDSNRYEVIHNYIAETFITYCNKELKHEVRGTIDSFITNFNDSYIKTIKDSLIKKDNVPIILNIIYYLSNVFVVIFGCYNFYINKNYPLIIIVPLVLSMFYGYSLYINIFYIYSKNFFNHMFYILLIMNVVGILSVFWPKYWTSFLCGSVIFIGVCLLIISSRGNLVEISKNFFKEFGTKVLLMGIFGLIFSFGIRGVFLLEFLSIMFLILYSSIAQLNESYYFYCLGLLHNKK